jgi:uncharacterized protein (TIGR02646 family)
MIYVERTPLPPELADRMRHAQQKINALHEDMRGSKGLQQRGLVFSDFHRVRPALELLFRNKCAYCEAALTSSPGDVENFRPKSLVADPDGNREGYWWLAYVWENLLLACGRCNRLHKLNKFPIEGPRAEPFATGDALRAELPLLIDPTDEDPSEYLSFEPKGKVMVAPALQALPDPAEAARKVRRAQTTIELLGLNREAIVSDRAGLHRTIQFFIKSFAGHKVSERLKIVIELLDPSKSYRAPTSQWITQAALAGRLALPAEEPLEEYLVRHGAVPQVVHRVIANAQRSRTQRTPGRARARQPRPVAVKAVEPARPAAATPAFIRQISIRNFKGIKRLDLELPFNAASTLPLPDGATDPVADASASSRTGWYVLLGENSAGKSSVLEAVALALMGKEQLGALVDAGRITLDKLVHQPQTAAAGARLPGCIIRLGLEPTELGEIDLRISGKGFRYAKGGAPVPTLVRGYGYVRLLPRPGEWQPEEDSAIRCENLFDPRAPLCDAEQWMATLPYDETKKSPFDIAAGAILNLLPNSTLAKAVPESEAQVATAHLEPRDGRVEMVLAARKLSLDQLSAGYQSVIALAADIMAGIPVDLLFDMREACGIVLLDEIGTQLHPSWRMRAIGDLRRAFPRIQFIATTHEPLCLKGVGRDELAVLKRDAANDEVIAVKSFQDPRTLRVDQLLTSPLFGLDSTIDPDVDRLFQRYFALLARRADLTDPEEEERRTLERALAPHRGLGYTRSDQIVYALLEEYLAGQGGRTIEDASQLPAAIRKKVFDVWQNVRVYRQGRT